MLNRTQIESRVPHAGTMCLLGKTPLLANDVAALSRARLDDLRAVLRRAANTFDQEAIYLTVAGIVEFVTATEADGFLL